MSLTHASVAIAAAIPDANVGWGDGRKNSLSWGFHNKAVSQGGAQAEGYGQAGGSVGGGKCHHELYGAVFPNLDIPQVQEVALKATWEAVSI